MTNRSHSLGVTNRSLPPSILHLLNKVNDPFLPPLSLFLTFHYCSCLVSVLVSLQSYYSLLFCHYPKCWLLPLHVKISSTNVSYFYTVKHIHQKRNVIYLQIYWFTFCLMNSIVSDITW